MQKCLAETMTPVPVMQAPNYQNTPRGLDMARSTLGFNRAQRHVQWALVIFCVGEFHFPWQKYPPYSFCARKFAGISVKAGRAAVAWEFLPHTRLSRRLFLRAESPALLLRGAQTISNAQTALKQHGPLRTRLRPGGRRIYAWICSPAQSGRKHANAG